MNKSYSQVMKQIQALQAEAEKLRRQEVDEVITRIREAITVYQLTAADLGLGSRKTGAPKVAVKRRAAKKIKVGGMSTAMKYRDEQGRGWVGRGKRPQWLRDALATGRTLQDFAVK